MNSAVQNKIIKKDIFEDGFVVKEDFSGERLDKVLSDIFREWSRTKVSRIIEHGGVELNGVVEKKLSKTLKNGDILKVDREVYKNLKEKLRSNKELMNFGQTGDKSLIQPEKIPLNIIYEDEEVLFVHKPAGMVVHPGTGNQSGTLVNALAWYFKDKGLEIPKKVGLVHRLDKDVSGLVLIAKNELAYMYFSEQFSGVGVKEGRVPDLRFKVRKFYRATVTIKERSKYRLSGLESGKWVKVSGYIRRSETNRKKFEFTNKSFLLGDKGRYCLSYMKINKNKQSRAIKDSVIVDIRIITGRTHQIRAQLESLGIPVVGDDLYGGIMESACEKGILLTCRMMSYIPIRVYKNLRVAGLVKNSKKILVEQVMSTDKIDNKGIFEYEKENIPIGHDFNRREITL